MPKLVEFGYCPKTSYIQQHLPAMKQLPFDGLVFEPTVTTPGFSNTRASVHVVSAASMPWPDWQTSLGQVDALPWGSFDTNYVRLNCKPWLDPFDDAGWKAALVNASLLARFAKQSGCKGIFFDNEDYDPRPPSAWQFSLFSATSQKSYPSFDLKMRQRGVEFVQALESEFAGIEFVYAHGYSDIEPTASYLPSATGRLLQPFLDGLFDGQRSAILCDGNERAYRAPNVAILDMILDSSRHPGAYVAKFPVQPRSARFSPASGWFRAYAGLSLDCYTSPSSWDGINAGNNKLSPFLLTTHLQHVMKAGDGMVWLYTEGDGTAANKRPCFWPLANVEKVYLDAIIAGKS